MTKNLDAAARLRAVRVLRGQLRLCVDCAAPATRGGQCDHHHAQRRDAGRRYRATPRGATRSRDAARDRRARLTAAGQCIVCAAPAAPHARCAGCRANNARFMAASRARRAASALRWAPPLTLALPLLNTLPPGWTLEDDVREEQHALTEIAIGWATYRSAMRAAVRP